MLASRALLILTLAVPGCSVSKVDAAVAAQVREAKELTIHAIDPREREKRKGTPGAKFRGFESIGQAVVNDPQEQAELADALGRSAKVERENLAKCFEPRHAIVADGVSYLICFECGQMYVNDDWRPVDSDGAAAMYEIWSAHGLDLAD